MNIKEFASVPKLIEISLDDNDLVERYGEPITFHTFDIVGLNTYFEFFNARTKGEYTQLDSIIKKLILNDKGVPALKENEDLPIDIAAAAINKIGEILGKSHSKTSTPTTGDQPE